ncbi:unnamed protein product [Ilex paraguariensis]|uniref:Uncharacterized protein n=1 Tax=Ilex paraguariensis TaxID=185542 RepID=A0ABC8SRI1_9AQUA
MAVDVYSEIPSLVVSPRISFSHDLREAEIVPVECHHHRSDAFLLDSPIDFDFCIGQTFKEELSPADELFANGKILPIEFKKIVPDTERTSHSSQTRQCWQSRGLGRSVSEVTKFVPTKEITKSEAVFVHPQTNKPSTTATESANEDTKKKMLKEFLSSSSEAEEEKPSSKCTKPFWQFGRSSSLNCDNSHNKGLFPSLQILLRSNSTGSAPNSGPRLLRKVSQKQNLQKQQSIPSSKASLSSTNVHCSYNPSKRPPLQKNCRSYSNGVRISPVLNIPPTYISVNLFGFGSFFCNGKSRKKKK